ncbi:hypothetical protein AGLY_009498 [Aphis glycines]|uniref:Uncharacterized protein n=1 Tax=Aphis glycines TaxID=307491 RepID=A0A6G0TJV2_APHGL|nr:hypothetical protein AGLY_009498 [Aphis glycines]
MESNMLFSLSVAKTYYLWKTLVSITFSGIVAKDLSLGAVASSKSLVLTCVHFSSSWNGSSYGFRPVLFVKNFNNNDNAQLITRITIIVLFRSLLLCDCNIIQIAHLVRFDMMKFHCFDKMQRIPTLLVSTSSGILISLGRTSLISLNCSNRALLYANSETHINILADHHEKVDNLICRWGQMVSYVVGGPCILRILYNWLDGSLDRVHVLVEYRVDLDRRMISGMRRSEHILEDSRKMSIYIFRLIGCLVPDRQKKVLALMDGGCELQLGQVYLVEVDDLQTKLSTPISSISTVHSSGKSSTPLTKTGGGALIGGRSFGELGVELELVELEWFLLVFCCTVHPSSC